MRIRIITFALDMPIDDYIRHASEIAPKFNAWPGLLGKWWLGGSPSGTHGGVYLFATREDADWSRETELFRAMRNNPGFRDLTIREYDVLETPTAVTAPAPYRAA